MRFSVGGGLGPFRMSIPLGSTRGAGRATGSMIEMMLKLCFYAIVIPIVAVALIIKYGYPPTKRFYTNPDPVVRGKRRLYTAIPLAVICTLAVPTSLLKLEVWSAILCGVAAVGCAYWAWHEYRAPIIAEEARIAARATEQNNAWLNGDPSGLYGANTPPQAPYDFVDTRQPW